MPHLEVISRKEGYEEGRNSSSRSPFCQYRRAAAVQIWLRWQLCSFADYWRRLCRHLWDTWARDRYRCQRNRHHRKAGPWSSPARRPWAVAAPRRRRPSFADRAAWRRLARSRRRWAARVGSVQAYPWSWASLHKDKACPRLGCRHLLTAVPNLHPKIQQTIVWNQIIVLFLQII